MHGCDRWIVPAAPDAHIWDYELLERLSMPAIGLLTEIAELASFLLSRGLEDPPFLNESTRARFKTLPFFLFQAVLKKALMTEIEEARDNPSYYCGTCNGFYYDD